MMHHPTENERWSPTGQFIAWTILGECALALTAISYAEFHRPRVLVVAAALAIGSVVLAARSRMPAQVKAGLITIVCAALLALAAALDPFGLRAIDHRIADATGQTNASAADPAAAAPVAVPQSMSQLNLRGKGDASAAIFADDLARSVAIKSGDDDGSYRIDGIIDVTAGVSGPAYRLTWSLGRQAETLWCGRIVAVSQDRAAAIDSFSTTIAAALRRARGGTMACS